MATRHAVFVSLAGGNAILFNGWVPSKGDPSRNALALCKREYDGRLDADGVLALAKKNIKGLPAAAVAVELADGIFEVRVEDAPVAEKGGKKS